MVITLIATFTLFLAAAAAPAEQHVVDSPDGRVVVRAALDDGELSYTVTLAGKTLLERSPLGLETEGGNWVRDLERVSVAPAERITDAYHLSHGKRSECRYVANRAVVTVRNAAGQSLRVEFQVSDDGVAFRYVLPAGGDGRGIAVYREATGFDLPQESRGWLMPMDEAMSGWKGVNPCYEAFYQMNVPVTLASPTRAGWAFPALFHVPDAGWMLISESGSDGRYCATRLSSPTADGLYAVAFPQAGENNGIGAAEPRIVLPWASPWRVIIVGQTPGPIVESTLVTDVAAPSKVADESFVRPGQATWSWLREKDSATIFDRQRDYVDLAAEVGFEYCLVDANWDRQIGYENIAKLTRYARQRGVDILLWYNTNGKWNDAPMTPKDRMDTHAARVAEFERIRGMGVTGVKVDFFGGDKQATLQLYMDLLADAAQAGIMVNCHGATIPRGWERTWPHLMTLEAVRGYENYTFRQADADRAGAHGCMQPFTRNVIGPMDFTPTCLGEFLNPERSVRRRTTRAFELALTVVYESGIQHFGLTPRDIEQAPAFVVEYLKALPPTWDDIRFIAGKPGEYVVLARRAGDRWFVAGINGADQPRDVTCDLSFIESELTGTLIEDGDEAQALHRRALEAGDDDELRLTLPPRGGFIWYSQD